MARTAELILKLTDKVTGPARAVTGTLNRLNTVMHGLDATGKAARSWAYVSNQLNAMDSAARNVAVGLSLPAATFGMWGAKTVYQIEDALNEIEGRTFGKNSTIRLETGVELDRTTFRQSLLEQVNQINAENPLTAQEIIAAWNQLTQAGLSFEQIQSVLPAALDYAVAGNIDANKAADDATNIAVSMRLPLETMAQAQATMRKVADTLTYSANITNADIAQMSESFKYAAPAAAALGIDIDQLSAMFAIMAQGGIKASEAGVAVRSMLVRMVRPTQMAQAALAKYGIDLNEYLTGNREITAEDITSALLFAGVDASDLSSQITQILQTEGLAPGQLGQQITEVIVGAIGDQSAIGRDKISDIINETLFSSSAELDVERLIEDMQAAGIAPADMFRIFDVRQGARILRLFGDDFERWVKKIQEGQTDFAETLRKTRMQGIVGAVNRFEAAMIDLFAAMANSGAMDAATNAINKVTDALNYLAEVNPKALEYGTYAIAALAVLGPLGLAVSGIVGLVKLIVIPIQTLTAALAGLAAVMLGPAAAAEATAAGGGLAAGIVGAVLKGLKIGGPIGIVVNELFNPAQVGAGEDAALMSQQWYRDSIAPYIVHPEAWPKGPVHRGLPRRAYQEEMDDLINGWRKKAGLGGQDVGKAIVLGASQKLTAQGPELSQRLEAIMSNLKVVAGAGIKIPLAFEVRSTAPTLQATPVTPRARGGGFQSGDLMLVGEEGPELMKAGTSGRVYSNRESGALMGRRGSVVNATININGAGSPEQVADLVIRKLDRLLDGSLQRSRQLSMEDRPEFG